MAGCRNATPSAASPSGASSRAAGLAAGHLDGTKWLERDATIAQSLGAGPLQVAATEVGGDGDRVGGFVDLPLEECMLAYARGSRGVEDLDLYAYGDDGTLLAADEATDPQPAIVICPPHPARAYLAARIVAGRGVVAIGVHPLLPSVAARVGRAMGARGRPGEEVGRVEAWPGLDEKVAQHRRLLGARWDEVRRVAVQSDARAATRISASIDGGRCLDVYVVPSEDFGQLDLAILDAEDRVLVRAPAIGRDRTAIVCSPVPISLSVELRPHTGQGLCAIVLGRSASGAEREISGPFFVVRPAPEGVLPAERALRGKALRSLGYAEPSIITSATATVGRRFGVPIDLPAGCARLDLVGARPLSGLTADLWDSSSNLIASGSSGDGPTLFACGRGGRARLDVEALSRPGPFAVELRREKTSPAALVAHPVAAGRLLAAIDSRSEPATASGVGDAKILALDTTSLKGFDFTVEDGHCTQITAALDAGAAGADLRIVDAQSSEEVSSARGRLVAQARACAEGSARNLRVELRLETGKTDALVAAKPTPAAAP